MGHGQNPDTLLGTLLRLEVDGDGPVQPEIWAYGLRNPWRFSFDRDTGDSTSPTWARTRWKR